MIVPHAYKDKQIAVFGLARTGLAAVQALQAAGARVLAWDDDAKRLEGVRDVAVNLYDADFTSLDALMLAPGVPLTHPAPHPLVVKAKDAGTQIIGDTEIFAAARANLPAHKLVAVTGTNGKSTTSALLAHMWDACHCPVALGGNIGVPILGLEPLKAGGVYVFELSSFQIDLTHSLEADVAILLNLTPDHLDRHGDMAGYVAAKRRLFSMQTEADVAIVGVDDEPGRMIAESLGKRAIPLSVTRPLDRGLYVDGEGTLVDARDGTKRSVGSLAGIASLKGRHNWQNAAAAYGAGISWGLAADEMLAAFQSFRGLHHRCEYLGSRNDVRFVNDSKATNIDAAATALAAYDAVRWIAGGRAKSTDLEPLSPYFPHIRHAYLIGEAAESFADALKGKVETTQCGSVEVATKAAHKDARPGETVLFSPACASFDQFPDFEVRGDAFRRAANAILEGGCA